MAEGDKYSEEFLQSKLEKLMLEAYAVHGWSVASSKNPVDILMLEEDDDDISDLPAPTVKATLRKIS